MALRAVPDICTLLPRLRHETPFRLRIPLALTALSVLQSAFGLPSAHPHAIPSPSSILRKLWDGLLRAVPKKKTTHSRSRMRQMAGKGLKDYMNVVGCPSCGRPKRAHFLCPYCVEDAREFMAMLAKESRHVTKTSLEKVKNHISVVYDQLKPRIPGERTRWPEEDSSREKLLERSEELAKTKKTLKARSSNQPELTKMRISELSEEAMRKMKDLARKQNDKDLVKEIPPSESSVESEKTV